MYERIVSKITHHRDKIVQTEDFFLEDAEIVLIVYGSESRPALDAVQRARAGGIKAGLLRLITVWPVPEKDILAVAKRASTVLAVEMNIGKYAGEIERIVAGLCQVVRVTKNQGMIHTSNELYAAIEGVVS